MSAPESAAKFCPTILVFRRQIFHQMINRVLDDSDSNRGIAMRLQIRTARSRTVASCKARE